MILTTFTIAIYSRIHVVCTYLYIYIHRTCSDLSGKGGRWDKSLGVLCQKFVMLFLITPVSLN